MRLRLGRLKYICKTTALLFFKANALRAAASLSYFLTLSVFPMLICLYHMLGGMFPATEELRLFLTGLLPASATATILEFLRYVSENTNQSMLVMALGALVTSSSAGYRCIRNVAAEMRGEARYSGFFQILFSIVFALVLLVTIYLSVILIVTGKWFLELADRHIMFLNISDSWSWGRFLLLFLLLFVILSWLYRLTVPRSGVREIRLVPGALLGALALVAVSIVFSSVISVNVTYPVVYGSLASLMILMLWFYLCGVVIFLGNALNITLERTP